MTTKTLSDITKQLDFGEAIFRKCYEEDRKPTFEERLFLSNTLGLDERQIRREQGRVARVSRLLAQAGTKAQREQLAESLAKAEEVRQTKGAELASEIERLTKERDAIVRDADAKQKRLEQAEDAAGALREVCPQHIREQHQRARSALNSTLRADLLAAENEIKGIRTIATFDPLTQEGIDHIRLQGRKYVVDRGTDRMRTTPGREHERESRTARYEVKPEWTQHVISEKKRLPELEKDLAAMQAEYDAEKEKLDAMLDYYIR